MSGVAPTTANTHISENFGKLLEPCLRKIFFETYKEIPEQFPKVYNVNTSKKHAEHDLHMGAFGDWVERTSEVDNVSYTKLKQGQQIDYIHKAFTRGFMISREMADDDLYGQMKKFPKALARAGRAFVEKEAMSLFVGAFTEKNYLGADGTTKESIIQADHKLIDSTKTCSNLAKGALSEASLKEAMKLMRETLDEAGNLVQFIPTKLIVPPALEHVAKVILNSSAVPGSNHNDVNTVKGSLELVVMDYLGEAAGGSDTAWYIMDGNQHEMNFFWRVKPEFKQTEDFDTLVAKYRGYMRFSYGCSDWRGIVGSTGTTTPEV